MAAPLPKPRKVSDIKSSLLRPALTSHFEVFIDLPPFMKPQQLNLVQQDQLNLQCTEASLPGSSLATFEINNDFHGVTERHAYRRIFDERIDLTFYVDADNYLPIRTFENWIGGIVNGNGDDGNLAKSNYYYTARYPEEYRTNLYITKFERSYEQDGSNIKYTFLDAFPISISAMPVSYDSSNLLKCTVGFTYLRYFTGNPKAKGETSAGGGAGTAGDGPPPTGNPDTNTALQNAQQTSTPDSNVQNLKNEIYDARMDMVMNRISADEFREIRSRNQALISQSGG